MTNCERQLACDQIMPALSDETYRALKADIREKGILMALVYDEDGEIIDGYHRWQAAKELRAAGDQIQEPEPIVLKGLSEAQKIDLVISLNLHRRHLTSAQKREVIDQLVRRYPQYSNGAIAGMAGVSDKTVAARRRSNPEIPELSFRRGRDGRVRPLRKYAPTAEQLQLDDALPQATTGSTQPAKKLEYWELEWTPDMRLLADWAQDQLRITTTHEAHFERAKEMLAAVKWLEVGLEKEMNQAVADMHDSGQGYENIANKLNVTKAQAERRGLAGGAITRSTRAQARSEAAAYGDKAAAMLDHTQVPYLLRTDDKTGGEWDWWRDLSSQEKARISKQHTSIVGSPPDEIVQYMINNGHLAQNVTIDEGMEEWLGLTRRGDSGASVAHGNVHLSTAAYGCLAGENTVKKLLGYMAEEEPPVPSYWEEHRPSCSGEAAPSEFDSEQQMLWRDEEEGKEEVVSVEEGPRLLPQGVTYIPIPDLGSCRLCTSTTVLTDESGPICRDCNARESGLSAPRTMDLF